MLLSGPGPGKRFRPRFRWRLGVSRLCKAKALQCVADGRHLRDSVFHRHHDPGFPGGPGGAVLNAVLLRRRPAGGGSMPAGCIPGHRHRGRAGPVRRHLPVGRPDPPVRGAGGRPGQDRLPPGPAVPPQGLAPGDPAGRPQDRDRAPGADAAQLLPDARQPMSLRKARGSTDRPTRKVRTTGSRSRCSTATATRTAWGTTFGGRRSS